MNFTLHQLRIFLEVARLENITKAASEMYMTQPALSIQLKNFQNQFDVALFDRVGKRIHLTDFGQSIVKIAENILREAEELKYKTSEYEGLLTGKLRISAASTGKYVIPFFLSDFMQSHTGIDLILDVSNKTSVMQNIQRNEVDFALISVIPEQIHLDEELLLPNKLYLVSKNKTLKKKDSIIYREEGSATRGAMNSYFKNVDQRKSLQLTSNEAVKQAVIAGLGYSILPLIGMRNEINNEDLYIIKRKGLPIETYWRLVWLRNKKLSPIASAYLEYIRENKQNIITNHFDWYI